MSTVDDETKLYSNTERIESSIVNTNPNVQPYNKRQVIINWALALILTIVVVVEANSYLSLSQRSEEVERLNTALGPKLAKLEQENERLKSSMIELTT